MAILGFEGRELKPYGEYTEISNLVEDDTYGSRTARIDHPSRRGDCAQINSAPNDALTRKFADRLTFFLVSRAISSMDRGMIATVSMSAPESIVLD